MQDFRKLEVFQRADALAERVYAHTHTFPSSERYGLTAQVRRAAVSAASNIAEGARRVSAGEFAHHLSIALGSASETSYLLGLSTRLKYLDKALGETLESEAEQICRMLIRLHERVAAKAHQRDP